jgi:hypothetical protein
MEWPSNSDNEQARAPRFLWSRGDSLSAPEAAAAATFASRQLKCFPTGIPKHTLALCVLGMRIHPINGRRRDPLTSFLLVMLLFRAYIPVGFMPASGTPFLLELCPAGAPMPMSMPMPAHHHHSDTHTHFEHCPFGSASASGPAPHLGAVNAVPLLILESAAPIELLPVGVQLVYLPQSRGPPLPA